MYCGFFAMSLPGQRHEVVQPPGGLHRRERGDDGDDHPEHDGWRRTRRKSESEHQDHQADTSRGAQADAPQPRAQNDAGQQETSSNHMVTPQGIVPERWFIPENALPRKQWARPTHAVILPLCRRRRITHRFVPVANRTLPGCTGHPISCRRHSIPGRTAGIDDA